MEALAGPEDMCRRLSTWVCTADVCPPRGWRFSCIDRQKQFGVFAVRIYHTTSTLAQTIMQCFLNSLQPESTFKLRTRGRVILVSVRYVQNKTYVKSHEIIRPTSKRQYNWAMLLSRENGEYIRYKNAYRDVLQRKTEKSTQAFM